MRFFDIFSVKIYLKNSIWKGATHLVESKQQGREQPLDQPNMDGNVWPKQTCPVFALREGAAVTISECWYCKYADFHLDKPRALEVGVCYFPKAINQ